MSDDAELQLMAALQGIPLEQAALMQRARRAQGLASAPSAQGQQLGRIYQASSPLEHLATAISRYQGNKQSGALDQEWSGLAQRAQQAGVAQARQKLLMRQEDIAREQAKTDRDFGLRKQGADLAEMQAMAREADAVRDAQYQRDTLAETTRAHKASEAAARASRDQDQWAAVPDQTGGIVMYNRKTGQYRPLGPQGPFPGAGSGLKPQQFEADVQAFGKDVEPIAKARPDVEALRAATQRDDVAGFGPVEGRIPNVVTSAEGVANRQSAGRLMAAIIQATSGQAASEKEVDRLLEANGMGRTATTEQLRQGIEKLDAQYQNLLKQREAKYHPQVVETYKQRGGFTSAPSLSAQDQQAKAWAEANPNDPRAAQIFERLKAKGL